nr:fluoride efflux transporter CrcB [Clostridium sp. MD294]
MQCLIVALGGGIGAMFRYMIGKINLPFEIAFPVTTLCINIIGAFIIGLVVSGAMKYTVSETVVLFLKTGLCGGFTTFSTFSLESVTLIEQKNVVMAFCYIASSILCCIIGVWLGKRVFL